MKKTSADIVEWISIFGFSHWIRSGLNGFIIVWWKKNLQQFKFEHSLGSKSHIKSSVHFMIPTMSEDYGMYFKIEWCFTSPPSQRQILLFPFYLLQDCSGTLNIMAFGLHFFTSKRLLFVVVKRNVCIWQVVLTGVSCCVPRRNLVRNATVQQITNVAWKKDGQLIDLQTQERIRWEPS